VRLPAPASVVEGERPASGRDALGSANDGMDEADATADHVSISGAYCSARILNVQAMAAQASMPIRLGGRATRGACRARGCQQGWSARRRPLPGAYLHIARQRSSSG
jgi:hypothetical protein